MDYINFYELYDGLKFYKESFETFFRNEAAFIYMAGLCVFALLIFHLSLFKKDVSNLTIFTLFIISILSSHAVVNFYEKTVKENHTLVEERNNEKLQILQRNLSKEELFELNAKIKMFGIKFSNMDRDERIKLEGDRSLIADSHHFEKVSLPTESEKADWENRIAFTVEEFIFFMEANRKALINESIEKEIQPKKEKEECITFCKLK